MNSGSPASYSTPNQPQNQTPPHESEPQSIADQEQHTEPIDEQTGHANIEYAEAVNALATCYWDKSLRAKASGQAAPQDATA